MKITVTHDDGATHDITEGVQVLYDHMANSMDWGSGFLDFEEVQAIRTLGYQCGFEFIGYTLDTCATCGHNKDRHKSDAPHCREAWRTHVEYVIDGVVQPRNFYPYAAAFYDLPESRRSATTVIDERGCSCSAYVSAPLLEIEGRNPSSTTRATERQPT